MASFMAPQPGDGAWLTQTPPKVKARRRKPASKKPKKALESFLERHDSAAEADVGATFSVSVSVSAVRTTPFDAQPAPLRRRIDTKTSEAAMPAKKAIPPHLRNKPPPPSVKAASPAASDRLAFRGRGGNGGILKSSEVPKGDPKRWDTDWAGHNLEEQSVGWAGESAAASAKAENGAGARLNSDEWNLQDFDGNWAPAPMDWDSRPAFRPGQSVAQVQRWLDNHEDVLIGCTRKPNLDDLSVVDGFTYTFGSPQNEKEGVEYQPMGDIIPRHWLPERIGRQPPKLFWDEHVHSNAPAPTDRGDLDGVRPWWENIVPGGPFLRPITPPAITGVDPDETADETMRRKADHGSAKHAENRKRIELAKRGITDEKMRRKAEKDKKKAARKDENGGRTPDSLIAIRPSLDRMYIRRANSDDVGGIRDIYNYYIDFTCAVAETKRLDKADWVEQLNDINHSKLPFLVAIEKGEVIKWRRNKKRRGFEDDEPLIMPDKLVGFALADEYGSGTDMYRFTAAMEVYVHKDHYMKGVASCLVDKLMAMLDPEYIERGGYTLNDETLEAAKPQRLIKHVIVNFNYTDENRLAWVSRWLTGWAGFREMGFLEGIGAKYGREVHKAMFQRTTGAVLDPHNLPDVI